MDGRSRMVAKYSFLESTKIEPKLKSAVLLCAQLAQRKMHLTTSENRLQVWYKQIL